MNVIRTNSLEITNLQATLVSTTEPKQVSNHLPQTLEHYHPQTIQKLQYSKM
jgi:hypothetical protein